jgi:hypothetical protein
MAAAAVLTCSGAEEVALVASAPAVVVGEALVLSVDFEDEDASTGPAGVALLGLGADGAGAAGDSGAEATGPAGVAGAGAALLVMVSTGVVLTVAVAVATTVGVSGAALVTGFWI